MLCVEIAKENMTPLEVARAYEEYNMGDDHWSDVVDTIFKHYDGEEVAKALIGIQDEHNED